MAEPSPFMRFANEAGVEAFQLLVARAEALGDAPFNEMLGALSGATAVCLANVLRPAVEASANKTAAADELVAVCARQARQFLQSIIDG